MNANAAMRAQAAQMQAMQANQAQRQPNQPGPMNNAMNEQMRAQAAAAGGSAGGAQGPAGLAGSGPANTHTPEGAVNAFLNALRAKDRDRLAEATALRAQTEASTDKTKELFGKIVDMSISDAELDDLAKKLQGFRISGENAHKSTGRLGIYIDKPSETGSMLRVTLTVRHEKKGWGVMDMSTKPIEFKPMNMNPRRKAATRG